MNINRGDMVFRERVCGMWRYAFFVVFFLATISFPFAAYAAGPITTSEFIAPAIEIVPAQLPKIAVSPQIGVKVPLGYTMDKETLQRLKNAPALSPEGGVQPTLRQDPAVMSKAPTPLAPGVLIDFEGRDNSVQPDGFIYSPSDSTIAAGPNHIVTVVNSVVNIHDKTGVLLLEASLASWFAASTPPGSPFDPKIVYDAQAGHWLLIALAKDTVSQAVFLLSVSQTSDPTGLWWNYSFSSVTTLRGDAWGDYEDIGFDGNLTGSVYISSNQFTFASDKFTTVQIVTISKTELYSGAGFYIFRTVNLRNSGGSKAFTIRPARTLSASNTEYMINTRPRGGRRVTLWSFVSAFPSPPVITRQATVGIGHYSPAPDAEQLGCADRLDTLDNRIYNAVFRNGQLYAAFTERHNWGSGRVAAARFFSIDTATNKTVINERFGADGFYYWLPAVTVDGSGNLVTVFAKSSATEYASINYTGHLATDAFMQGSQRLKAGEACIGGFRWGDYFGISVDPVDNANVWIFGEWAKDVPGVPFDWDWGTWIGEVSYTIATPPAITLTLTPDSVVTVPGGTLGYQINAVNTTASIQCLKYWEDLIFPNGTTYPSVGEFFGPVRVCLNPGATKNVHMVQDVPLGTQLGSYVYNGYVGFYPEVDNSSSFNFDVIRLGIAPATKNTGGPWKLGENGFRK